MAELGSNVTIPCTYTYPHLYFTEDVQVYWKKLQKSTFDTKDNDKNAFVYHKNDSFVLEKYRGKTMLIGNKDNGNCSLVIQNVQDNDQDIYLRIIVKGQQYSFKKKRVTISVRGKNFRKALEV